MTGHLSLVDSTYAWRRLAASVTLSTLGGIGMWCLAVALPAVQADLGISRSDISFAYSMNMIGFFVGGGLAAAASPRAVYFAAGAGGLVVLSLAALRLRGASWPGRRPSRTDNVAVAGHGPIPD